MWCKMVYDEEKSVRGGKQCKIKVSKVGVDDDDGDDE